MKIFLSSDNPRKDIQRVLDYWHKHTDKLMFVREEKYQQGNVDTEIAKDYLILNIKNIGIIQLLNYYRGDWRPISEKELAEDMGY